MVKVRRNKILDVAVDLAEEGGFDNVRQRDVAAHAGVALGTLYKNFRSKEDLLSAALEREAEHLERRMEDNPAKGDTLLERVLFVFQLMTRALCRKPNYARAVLRSMASGVPEVAANITAYQGRVNGILIAAMRGVGRLGYTELTSSPPTEDESTLSFLLQQLWFASLVGWSAGLIDQNAILEQMRIAGELLVRGMEPAKTGKK
jgi:TetR/AcrR family transcriptional regulator, cholesterol catabolism regulator